MLLKGSQIKKPYVVTLYRPNVNPHSPLHLRCREIGRYRWLWLAKFVAWWVEGYHEHAEVLKTEQLWVRDDKCR